MCAVAVVSMLIIGFAWPSTTTTKSETSGTESPTDPHRHLPSKGRHVYPQVINGQPISILPLPSPTQSSPPLLSPTVPSPPPSLQSSYSSSLPSYLPLVLSPLPSLPISPSSLTSFSIIRTFLSLPYLSLHSSCCWLLS